MSERKTAFGIIGMSGNFQMIGENVGLGCGTKKLDELLKF